MYDKKIIHISDIAVKPVDFGIVKKGAASVPQST